MIRRSWTQAASVKRRLRYGRRRFGNQDADASVVPAKSVLRRMQACFWKVCSEMSTAKLVGCAQRQLAILGLGGNRRSLVAGIGMLMACAISCAIMSSRHLADDDAVLVIDETGFLKQGKASCGWRDNTLVLGKITNCQIRSSLPMFRATVTRSSIALSSKEWTDDPDRLEAAYVPSGVGFATKPQRATRMIAHAIAFCAIQVGCGDTVRCWRYRTATTPGRQRLCTRGSAALMYFIPGASGDPSPARLRTLPGRGARPTGNACRQGPEPKDRGCIVGAISNWPISRSKNLTNPRSLWTRGLLIRRHITDGDLAFFTTWCQRQHPSKRWWRSKAIGGRSRTVLRPRKTSSDSITTRADPGMGGIATFPW